MAPLKELRPSSDSLGVKLWTLLRSRTWSVLMGLLLVVVGMGWSFLWGPLHGHPHVWTTPGDLWATYRAAQFVSWGGLGAIYSAGTYLVTLPGIAILLAPVALVCDHFHLSEGFPLLIPHPTAWPIVGTASLLCALPLLTATESLCSDLGTTRAVRRLAVAAVAGLCFPAVAMLGHPEDALSLGLSLYALRAAHGRRWAASAWWLGAAISIQPLSLLVLPLLMGTAGWRRSPSYVVRAAVFPVLLVGVVLSADAHDAWNQLLHQPNYPTAPVNHPTPWLALAPRLSHLTVAAGPGREIALVLSLGLVAWGVRGRGRLDTLLAGAMVAFALRPVFEAVIVPFYLTPALVLAVLVAARRGPGRLALCALAVLATTVVSFFHYGPWSYWSAITAGLTLAMVAAAAPGLRLGSRLPLAHDGGQDAVDEAGGVLRRVALG